MAVAAVSTEAGETGRQRAEPPSLERLAAAFPQLEVIEFIGQGGMGAVYKACQKQLDRIVALKVLPPGIGGAPSFAERFTREAKALAKLLHPNIVALFEFGQAGGIYYLLMEFVDGVSLGQLLRASRVSAREALAIVPQICDALQYAHDQGIVHRDIKPENILLDRRGRVKVADFGLAKLVEPASLTPSLSPPDGERVAAKPGEGKAAVLTGAGKIMGTPNYMAPEQVEHPGEVDHRADIYALGVVFYQMLTGELPGKRMEPPSRKVQIDVRLDEVVMRALEKKPELRYQQVSEVKTMVETIVGMPAPAQGCDHRSKATFFDCTKQGVDYRSKATLFGLPLLHVTSGVDPQTGRARVAKGIIAIGGVAQGAIAFGGVAMGGFAFGGLAIGVFAFGGCALGLVAFGGLAMALIAAIGGGAIAPIAIGGGAVGYLAFGGGAVGVHVLDAVTKDPVAKQFFLPWAKVLMANIQWLIAAVFIPIIGIGVGVPLWIQKRGGRQTARMPEDKGLEGASSTARPAATRGRRRAALIVALVVWFFVTGTVTLITSIRAPSWKVVAVISCPRKSQPGRPVEVLYNHTAAMIELIRSDVILGRVIDRLELDERSGKLDERWGKRNLGLKLTKAQAMVLLRRRLDVRSSEGGTLIQVGVYGKRPEKWEEAIDIADTIAEELRAFRIEQHDSPADMLEMTVRATPPDILLGLAAGFVLGLLARGLVLWRGSLRRGSQASQVKKGVETTVGSAGVPPAEPARKNSTGKMIAIGCGVLLAGGLVVLLLATALRFGLGKEVAIKRETERRKAELARQQADESLAKLRAGNIAETAPTAQNPSFGPVIERVVIDSKTGFEREAERTNALMMIDFGSGSLLAGPAAMWAAETSAQIAWMQTNGVDALAVIPGVNGLVGLDMKAVSVPVQAWDDLSAVSVSEQLAQIKSKDTTLLGLSNSLRSTWLFQTRKGRAGILQITGFTENPRGVKIRYKLILPQSADLSAQSAHVVLANTNTAGFGPVKEVSAATARKGDIEVRLSCIGTVESSNSLFFAIPQDYCQEVIRKFDAHQALTVEAYDRTGQKRFGRGFLAGVDNRIDPETATLKCRASLIPEGENLMVPGLFLNIHLLLEVKHGVTLVPVDAISHGVQGAYVWAIKPDQTVSVRYVQTGTIGGAKAEIQSGLSPGEVVVTDGSYYLREGQKIYYKQVLPQNDEGE
jgi:hypothetical protein